NGQGAIRFSDIHLIRMEDRGKVGAHGYVPYSPDKEFQEHHGRKLNAGACSHIAYLMLTNWSGCPKFSARSLAITAWRSSIFFPCTRTWSSMIEPWTFNFISLIRLLIFLAVSLSIPSLIRTSFRIIFPEAYSSFPKSRHSGSSCCFSMREISTSWIAFRRISFSVTMVMRLDFLSSSMVVSDP